MSADKSDPTPKTPNDSMTNPQQSDNCNIVNDAQPVGNHNNIDGARGEEYLSETTVATLPNHMSALSLSRNPNELTNYQGGNRQNSQIINIVGGNAVHIGPNIMIPAQFAENMRSVEKTADAKILRTRTIDDMLNCNDPVDQECIQLVAEHLGKGWQAVLRRLGHTDAFIEQIDRDFQKDGTKEIIYQGLRAWMRKADDHEATIAVLTSVLWRNGHKSCVVKLKDWFKNRSKNDR